MVPSMSAASIATSGVFKCIVCFIWRFSHVHHQQYILCITSCFCPTPQSKYIIAVISLCLCSLIFTSLWSLTGLDTSSHCAIKLVHVFCIKQKFFSQAASDKILGWWQGPFLSKVIIVVKEKTTPSNNLFFKPRMVIEHSMKTCDTLLSDVKVRNSEKFFLCSHTSAGSFFFKLHILCMVQCKYEVCGTGALCVGNLKQIQHKHQLFYKNKPVTCCVCVCVARLL